MLPKIIFKQLHTSLPWFWWPLLTKAGALSLSRFVLFKGNPTKSNPVSGIKDNYIKIACPAYIEASFNWKQCETTSTAHLIKQPMGQMYGCRLHKQKSRGHVSNSSFQSYELCFVLRNNVHNCFLMWRFYWKTTSFIRGPLKTASNPQEKYKTPSDLTLLWLKFGRKNHLVKVRETLWSQLKGIVRWTAVFVFTNHFLWWLCDFQTSSHYFFICFWRRSSRAFFT